jgi:hypothetical protein
MGDTVTDTFELLPPCGRSWEEYHKCLENRREGIHDTSCPEFSKHWPCGNIREKQQ